MTTVTHLFRPDETRRPGPSPPETVLWDDRPYEGGNRPLEPSAGGSVDERVRALCDPVVFEEDGRTSPFYAIAGERGIAGGELLE